MKRLTEDVFDSVREAVEEEAKKRYEGGFFIMADILTGMAMFSLINKETPLRLNIPGKDDLNFAAIAGAKFGKVFAHREHSGGETTIKGELHYMGGRISRDGEFIYAFSGAPQEIDDALMVVAEKAHAATFSSEGGGA